MTIGCLFPTSANRGIGRPETRSRPARAYGRRKPKRLYESVLWDTRRARKRPAGNVAGALEDFGAGLEGWGR